MFNFHQNKSKYFHFQFQTTKDFIIPFISSSLPAKEKLNVLEIGCAEAGVLKAFTDLGHQCVGIELSAKRVELAKEFMAEELDKQQINFIVRDIYDIDVEADIGYRFDLVILKDVIEHIHDQAKFITRLKEFLNPGGIVFFGFPPWQMPFGGHQQMCTTKVLSKLPYFHLLPRPMYRALLQVSGEPEDKVENLLEIKDTGISIERFERIVKQENFDIAATQLFLTNPIYRFKFGLKVRRQGKLMASLPVIRNYFTTCAYYVIQERANTGN